MLMYSTNHSQGLLHYVEQKCDVTDNREERTRAPFRRDTATRIKCKSWKILSLYKKYSSLYSGLYFHFCLSPTKSYHLRTVLESRLKGWEKVNIHQVQIVISCELAVFSMCYLADKRCQRSTLLLCCWSSLSYSEFSFSAIIDHCFFVWIAISSSLYTIQRLSLKYKSFSSNLCRMFFAQICTLKTLFAVQYLNYIRYMAAFFWKIAALSRI